MRNYNNSSKVEEYFSKQFRDDTEIRTLQVDNYISLGQVTALRFLEWAGLNPGGVISLPTGKTPEFFIKWVMHYLNNWDNEEIIKDLGLVKPDFKTHHFFQIDEFFPISPDNKKSFYYFVKKYYIDGFGFDEKKVHLIRTDYIKKYNLLERFNEGVYLDSKDKALKEFNKFCNYYEKEIRDLGGIGFFLGGIGPDGHIAFNISWSEEDSKTRLLNLNYPSKAAVASDLGGISQVSKKAVVTIGLGTITYNPNCTAIIIAAGHGKSRVVKNSILSSDFNKEFPATALLKLKNARFYITDSASISINPGDPDIDKNHIIDCLNNGLVEIKNKTILHTAPHHDDIELAYFPFIQDLVQDNKNYFAYCTSGYTSVTDNHLDDIVSSCDVDYDIEGTTYEDDIIDYVDTFNISYFKRRLERKLFEVGGVSFDLHYDSDLVKKAKGWIREMEAECLCRFNGIDTDNIKHLRLPFYSDDIFPKYPDKDKDVKPILDYLLEIKPDIITLALDPEGSGPDTHFKTLIALSEAIDLYKKVNKNVRIWGYRNVWSVFNLSDINLIIPTNHLKMYPFKKLFDVCYLSQSSAEFPSYKTTKSFPEIAIKVWRGQYDVLKFILGRDYFLKNSNNKIKTCSGCIYIKDMSVDDFEREMQYVKRVLDMKNKL